jgi:hypothetical protein
MNLASTRRNWPAGRGFECFYGFSGEPYVDLEREAAMMLARELRAAGWFWPRTRKG